MTFERGTVRDTLPVGGGSMRRLTVGSVGKDRRQEDTKPTAWSDRNHPFALAFACRYSNTVANLTLVEPHTALEARSFAKPCLVLIPARAALTHDPWFPLPATFQLREMCSEGIVATEWGQLHSSRGGCRKNHSRYTCSS